MFWPSRELLSWSALPAELVADAKASDFAECGMISSALGQSFGCVPVGGDDRLAGSFIGAA